ncbi:reverse transcriptase [Caerostris darwini]|uniref:RNA-directed DNA polymerase n=1 Tax=Caerostris darwini TaxID=1538125 RepID=A0AAV4QSD6_9ARAC|nr:reverse transcriptase [Caerostris darwini]
MNDHAIELYCYVVSDRIRPFVPEGDRKKHFPVCILLHILVLRLLVEERYVWSRIKADVGTWAQQCLACQRSKVTRHTQSKLAVFISSNARFYHVHIDIVGPLPPSGGFCYCLTYVDHFSKWPEAYPLVYISASSVASTFYTERVSRFGPPLRITTDKGTQFETLLFGALTKFLGATRHRTNPYHPT